MEGHCFHEIELGKMQSSIERIEKEVLGNGKEGLSQTVPVLSEKIDTLIETVSDLRTTVSGFAKFEAGYQAEQTQKGRGFTKTATIASIVIAFLGMLIAFRIMNNQTTEKVRDMVDQYSYDLKFRGADSDSINVM